MPSKMVLGSCLSFSRSHMLFRTWCCACAVRDLRSTACDQICESHHAQSIGWQSPLTVGSACPHLLSVLFRLCFTPVAFSTITPIEKLSHRVVSFLKGATFTSPERATTALPTRSTPITVSSNMVYAIYPPIFYAIYPPSAGIPALLIPLGFYWA